MKTSGLTIFVAGIIATMLAVPCCGGEANGTNRFFVDAQTLITLDRTSCMGAACPDYFLSVGGEGTVTFVGRRYVKVVGTAIERIPVADVQTLVDAMEEMKYFELSVPPTCAKGYKSDQPMVTTSLTLAGTTHVVQHHFCNLCAPEVLHTIEDLVDIVAQSAQWVKCDTATGICPL